MKMKSLRHESEVLDHYIALVLELDEYYQSGDYDAPGVALLHSTLEDLGRRLSSADRRAYADWDIRRKTGDDNEFGHANRSGGKGRPRNR